MDEQERDHVASEGEARIEETSEDCVQDVFPGATAGDQQDRRVVGEGTLTSAQEREIPNMVVFVTGVARGIGRAVTARCLAADMNVVAVDENERALARLSQEVPAGSSMTVVVRDVARQETAEAAVAHALESFGRLDGIVSNAGIFHSVPLSETTLDAWQRVLDV
jgi:FlaA1/EpsC-like NDP-sugar epimerase